VDERRRLACSCGDEADAGASPRALVQPSFGAAETLAALSWNAAGAYPEATTASIRAEAEAVDGMRDAATYRFD
jgi:hypothetical protein